MSRSWSLFNKKKKESAVPAPDVTPIGDTTKPLAPPPPAIDNDDDDDSPRYSDLPSYTEVSIYYRIFINVCFFCLNRC